MKVVASRPTLATLPAGIAPTLWVLATVVAFLVLAYLGVFFSTRHFTNGSDFLPVYRVPFLVESIIYYRMDYALNSSEYNDVVFLGSSAGATGIIPTAFEQGTGLRAYNLGTIRPFGPDADLEIFKTYLQNHPAPRMLVYLAYPPDLAHNSSDSPELRHRFVRAYGTDLQYKAPPPPLSPLHYLRDGIQALYGITKGGADYYFHYDRATDQINRDLGERGHRFTHAATGPMLAWERGYQEYPARQNEELGLDSHRAISEYSVSPWYQSAFTEMAGLAQARDIRFMVWIMPVPRLEVPTEAGSLSRWAQEFRAAHPEVEVRGLPVQEYPHDMYGNENHMTRAGAETLTTIVTRDFESLLDDLKADSPGLRATQPQP